MLPNWMLCLGRRDDLKPRTTNLLRLRVFAGPLFFPQFLAEAADVLHELFAEDVACQGGAAEADEENLQGGCVVDTVHNPVGDGGADGPLGRHDDAEIEPGPAGNQKFPLRPHISQMEDRGREDREQVGNAGGRDGVEVRL